MSILLVNNSDSHVLRSVVEHVFMPPKLSQEDPGDQIEQRTNLVLCDNLLEAARNFLPDVPSSQISLWTHMINMMELCRRAVEAPLGEAGLQDVFSSMAIGGMYMKLPLRSAFHETFFYQMSFLYIFVHRTPLLLCAGFPPLTSFSSRCSKSRLKIPP